MSTGGTFTTDLPPDTVLGNLSDEDYLAVCEAATAYAVSSLQVGLCPYFAAAQAIEQGGTDTQILTTCLGTVLLCQSLPLDQTQCTPPEAECTATVGQVEECVNDMSVAADEMGEQAPSCMTLTATTVPPALPDATAATSLDSCALLEQACPGILGGANAGIVEVPGTGGAGSGGAPAAGGAAGAGG